MQPERGGRQLDVEQLLRIVLAALQLGDDDGALGLAVVGLVEARVHALGFDEQHAIERVARRRFEVGGLIDPGVAVPGAAKLLDDALHLVARDVARALEVHVLDPVRHAGQARAFVLRADLVPAPDRGQRRGVDLLDEHLEPVVEDGFAHVGRGQFEARHGHTAIITIDRPSCLSGRTPVTCRGPLSR